MINKYCGSLRETFAELVYYGILESKDAQCFRVETRIEYGSYILMVGAILLAFLNTFVMKAVVQYFRDKEEEDRLMEEGVSKVDDTTLYSMDSAVLKKIRPVPVLFTDTFRWILRREDGVQGTRGWVLRREDDASSGAGSNLASFRRSHRGGRVISDRESTRGSSVNVSSRFERTDSDFDCDETIPMTKFVSRNAVNHPMATLTNGIPTSKDEGSLCYSASVTHNTVPDVERDTCNTVPLIDADYDYSVGEFKGVENNQKQEPFADEYQTADGTMTTASRRLFGDDLQTLGETVSSNVDRRSLAGSRTSQQSLESRRRSDDELLADAIHSIYGRKGDSIHDR
jgi:hypothetical protein